MTNRATATWQLLDIAVAGRAEELLTRSRRDGLTYDQIAQTLAADYGIKVSREWVRLHCVRLGIEKRAA